MTHRGKPNSLFLPAMLLCLLLAAALVSCQSSGGGTTTGQKQGGGQVNVPGGAEPIDQQWVEDAFDEFIGLKPKGKPKVFTKVTEFFPPGPETKEVSAAANAAGWSWGAGIEFTGGNVSLAEAHALQFSDPSGAEKVAKAWTDQMEAVFTTIKARTIKGSLSNGTPYSGFTVSLLAGEDEVLMVAPQGNMLFEMVIVGSPKVADEQHVADWLSKLAEAAPQ
ncbi:MAG: hypothetical protein WD276_09850 [Actinomycetota bacterium]